MLGTLRRRNITGGFLVRGLGAVASLLLNVVVARTMDIEAAGLFLLTISMMLFMSSVVRFGSDSVAIRLLSGPLRRSASGVDGAAAREVGSTGQGPSEVFTSLFYLVVLAFLASTALLALAAWLFGRGSWGTGPVVVALPVLTLLYSLVFSLSNVGLAGGKVVVGLTTRNVIGNLVTALILAVASVAVPRVTLWPAYGSLAAGLVVAAIVAVYMFVVPTGLSLTGARLADVLRLARFSVPYAVTSFFEQALLWGGQLASAALLSSDDIARLASAQRVAMVLAFGLMVVNSVIAPRFAAAHDEGDHAQVRRLYRRSLLLSAAIGVPLFVVLFTGAGPVMRMFGPAYGDAAGVLRILLVGQLINVVTGPATQRLLMTDRQRTVAVSYAVAAVATFAAAFVVVPAYGLPGMAVAMTAGLSLHKAVLVIAAGR